MDGRRTKARKRRGAFASGWSDEGQLVVVPPAGAKGGAFSAGGEISALAAVRDEAGAATDFADRTASGALTAAHGERVDDFGALNSTLPDPESNPAAAVSEVALELPPETVEGAPDTPAAAAAGRGPPLETAEGIPDAPAAAAAGGGFVRLYHCSRFVALVALSLLHPEATSAGIVFAEY
eukprot:XP_008654001.1 testis-specific gene A8 protein-like [Zea mays]